MVQFKISANVQVPLMAKDKCSHKNHSFKIFTSFLSESHTIIHLKWRSSRPELFYKNRVLRNFVKVTGKHLCQSLKPGLKPANLLKLRLWHSCFPVNFVKFLRTSFLIEHLLWLLLKIIQRSKRKCLVYLVKTP